LITISGEDYADLVHGLESLGHSVDRWNARGGDDPPNYIKDKSPVAIVREMLSRCPDASPSPATNELAFISDVALRESIRLDVSTASSALHNGEWKAATVLAGSAVEALLLWVIQANSPQLSTLSTVPRGSLRGGPISSVAAWAVVIAELFERAGINLEILGYTTRAWKGGQSRDAWIADGKPPSPGRLNDLRHIIYKSVEEVFEEATANCSIMLRDGLLKEGIDGEALLWAYSRLEKLDAKKRILFIVSDGAPVDDSTLAVNPGDFLTKHLASTARWVEETKRVDLVAIGIGNEPRQYANANIVTRENVGVPILNHLMELLRSSKAV
jgi:hypothetical protein